MWNTCGRQTPHAPPADGNRRQRQIISAGRANRAATAIPTAAVKLWSP